MPYILALTVLDVLINFFLAQKGISKEYREIGIGEIISGYFFSCLMVSWHRVVIHGPDRYEPMNPFKPKLSEWAFIGMGVLIFLIAGFVGGLFIGGFSVIAAHMQSPHIFALIFPVIVLIVYCIIRYSFYFPAKATENSITLKQSILMSKGYVWKLFASNILAALKTFFIMIGYLIIGIVVLGMISGVAAVAFQIDPKAVGQFLGLFLALPIVLYFQPLLAIIGITVLSNYYQHALQTKGIPDTA